MNVYWLEQSERDLPAEDDWLSASEAVCLNALHFAKRRVDWQLGRWTAKCALSAYLAVPAHSEMFKKIDIRPASDGAPEAFIGGQAAGVMISLSHRSGMAICAVAATGVDLGCDLELVEPRSDSFIADYFAIEEQGRIAQASVGDRHRLVTLLWSAKESALKALRAGLRLDTRSVTVDPFVTSSEFAGQGDGELDSHRRSELDGWSPLTVRYASRCSLENLSDDHHHSIDRVFHGWWQTAGDIVRTMVGAPAPESPILLRGQGHTFDHAFDHAFDRAFGSPGERAKKIV
jgi:4'-phosphopantetheinyl transferase